MPSWDDYAGVLCPACNREAFQFLEGVCMRCLREGWVKSDKEEERLKTVKERGKKHGLWVLKKKGKPPN